MYCNSKLRHQRLQDFVKCVNILSFSICFIFIYIVIIDVLLYMCKVTISIKSNVFSFIYLINNAKQRDATMTLSLVASRTDFSGFHYNTAICFRVKVIPRLYLNIP